MLIIGALVLGWPTDSAWAGTRDEAERQAGFAADELATGDYHRALKSAESALRLDPARYDAILLKARAYEGLGNLELAESLTLAYGEFVGGLEDRPEAQLVLDRIRASREATNKRPRDRVALLRQRVEPVNLTIEEPERVDPGPYRERVVAALAGGLCHAASSAATELTMTAPDVADGWKLAGDAARCSGDLRGALLAYRRYQREGGDESSTTALIDRLAGKFGTLLVRVEAPSEAAPIRTRVVVGDEDIADEPTPQGARRLRDLPLGQPLTLTVSGRGLRPLELQLEPLKAGEVREFDVTPEWLGLATVKLAHFENTARVVLLTEDAEVAADAGQSYSLSAASAWALVENEFGVQSVPLLVEPQAILDFDPTPYLPARLAVAGVPAGAMVTVDVTADDGRRGGWTDVLPFDVGAIHIDTGVRVAPVHNVDSLPGGVGTLHVEHPTLGEKQVEVVLETGTLNAVTFDWRPLPGVTLVAERYAEWQRVQVQVRRGRSRTAALGVTSGVLAAIGGGLLVGALVVEGQANAARDRAVAAHGVQDSAALTLAIADFKAAQGRSRALGISAGVGFGLSGLSVVMTFGSGAGARRISAALGPWSD